MYALRAAFLALGLTVLSTANNLSPNDAISTLVSEHPDTHKPVASVGAHADAVTTDSQVTNAVFHHEIDRSDFLPPADLPYWLTSCGLKDIVGAQLDTIPANCEVPAWVSMHHWLPRSADETAEHTVLTTVVTAHITVIHTVVAGYETGKAWTSTIVISGHGSSTDPLNPITRSSIDSATEQHHTTTTTEVPLKSSTSGSTASDISTATPSPLTPVSTVVAPSKLTSLLSTLLTDTKSVTSAPTKSSTFTKQLQSFTSTLGSTANAVDTKLAKGLPAVLAGLIGCFALALIL